LNKQDGGGKLFSDSSSSDSSDESDSLPEEFTNNGVENNEFL
jgi:hypothetical protein